MASSQSRRVKLNCYRTEDEKGVSDIIEKFKKIFLNDISFSR